MMGSMEEQPKKPRGFDKTPLWILLVVFVLFVCAMLAHQPPLAVMMFLVGIIAEVTWLIWSGTK